jgi:phosphate starvation-inducible PhoH-like protein
MAKKPRKKEVADTTNIDEYVLLNNIETSTKKEWFLNYKIHNQFKLNDVHNSFVELMLYKDTKMIFVDGPAGSGKSYLAVYGALQLLLKKQINQIVYIRSIVESASKSMGSLPGELQDKFQPWSLPLIEKLDELVGPKIGGELVRNNYIKCMPVNFVRGLTFRDSVVIVDESQNLTTAELTTILTRFGENTKYVVIGDSFQSDIGSKNGFSKIRTAFNDQESEDKCIHNFVFSENEVVRSQILKFIVKKLENIQSH